MQVLGIDIGGTGIKAAPVDTTTGTLLTERIKVETPHPAQPDAVAAVVAQHVKRFDWTGPVGITFPGVVVNGVTGHISGSRPWSWIKVSLVVLAALILFLLFAYLNNS